jgi:DNA-binding SARP family transcriptional activator/Tfp pilus assembly protein PilF
MRFPAYDMFALRLLGGLSLESEAAPVAPGAQQRRRLSLLALLALAGERGMSRDRLQAYMWPESDAARARHALDQLLYATRRDLRAESILTSGSADLRLNAGVIGPDLWRFDAAIRSEAWQLAAEMYGGPLLDGVHLDLGPDFEQMLDAERLRREHDYHHALEVLARQAAADGNAPEAIRWWRRRSLAEPTSLPVALELMRALAAAGDRAGAVQYARTYQRLIRETLEIEPDAAVDALARQIAARAGDATSTRSIELATSATDTTVPVAPPGEPERFSAVQPREHSTIALAAERPRMWRPRTLTVGLGAALTIAVLPLIRSGFSAHSESLSPPVAGASASTSAALQQGGPKLSTAESETEVRSSDPEARVLYLRGRAEWNKRSKLGLDSAVVLYRRAIDRDPTFAAAYTGLAEAYVMLGYFGFAPADATFPKSRAAALRALELDPHDGEAYAALGQVLAGEHAWAQADEAYRRALQLSPGNATVHQWYALLFAYLGRAHDAAVHTAMASRLDPLSVQINNMYGMMLYYDHDLSGAMRQYERTVIDEPDSAWVRQNPWVLTNFARVAIAAGHYEQALHLVNRALVVVPTHPRALFDLAMVYLAKGDTATARATLARADSTNPQYAADRACFYGLLGDFDRAYGLFDRIKEMPLPQLVTITNEPALAAMRADPRYQQLRRRLAMPPQ